MLFLLLEIECSKINYLYFSVDLNYKYVKLNILFYVEVNYIKRGYSDFLFGSMVNLKL